MEDIKALNEALKNATAAGDTEAIEGISSYINSLTSVTPIEPVDAPYGTFETPPEETQPESISELTFALEEAKKAGDKEAVKGISD